MEIKRDLYLNRLISRMNNGSVKVITGIRRCGKSYLLFNLFYNYLLEQGISENHIIRYQMDNVSNAELRDALKLYNEIISKISGNENYYVFLDEIQFVNNFSELVNSLNQIKNLDVYVTGSNSKFLSSDILTEFRGRGDEVRIYPLSFSEFYSVYDGEKMEAFDEYTTFGGMPALLSRNNEEEKTEYLKTLVSKVYLSDIVDRNNVLYKDELDSIFDFLCSSIGSLTNPKRISDTLKSVKGKSISDNTAKNYLDYLCEAFLFNNSKRFDVKGKKYFDTPSKYYIVDIGLRNARLNFRQDEPTHIMENIIYNELKIRGFSVDVGIVETSETVNNKRIRKTLEVDFVANKGNKKIYIQSAYNIPSTDKENQEKRSLLKISDNFKKIILVNGIKREQIDENGIVTMGVINFLLNANCLEI